MELLITGLDSVHELVQGIVDNRIGWVQDLNLSLKLLSTTSAPSCHGLGKVWIWLEGLSLSLKSKVCQTPSKSRKVCVGVRGSEGWCECLD